MIPWRAENRLQCDFAPAGGGEAGVALTKAAPVRMSDTMAHLLTLETHRASERFRSKGLNSGAFCACFHET